MSLFVALVIGLIVGGAAGYFMVKAEDTVLLCVLMGVCGSIFGLALYGLTRTDSTEDVGLFNGRAAAASLLCSLIFVLAFLGLQKIFPKRSHSTSKDDDDDGKVED